MYEPKRSIKLTQDSLQTPLQDSTSNNLHENHDSISLASPNGRLIYEKSKDLIIKSKYYKSEVNKLLYLTEGNVCYGIIKLHLPEKITVKEFNDLYLRHKLSHDSRMKWWPGKEVLYSYQFDVIDLFDSPQRVTFSKESLFSKEFTLSVYELIKDIVNYDPKAVSDLVLRDDWRILTAWYSTISSGKPFKYTIKQVIDLAKRIFNERLERGCKFHPANMTPAGKALYRIVTGEDEPENSEIDLSNPRLWSHFQDATLIKGFANIVGSCVKPKPAKLPNDLDIQLRMKDPPAYLKRAIEVRVCKDFPHWQKIHFIWGDPEGPHDNFVPLFDLCLKRVKPVKVISMSDVKICSLDPISPMKPKERFYQVDEAVSYMFKTGDKYATEKKFNGYRGILIKSGDSVRLFSKHKNDISKHFPTILTESVNLTSKDMILDCEILYKEGGRAEIAKFITGKQEISDKDITLHCFDIIYLNKDVKNEEWHERKHVLHSLHFTPHIKEVSSIIVTDSSKAKKAITLLRNLKGSEGAMIKRYSGPGSVYTPGKESDAWIKFRNEDTLTVKVLKPIKTSNGFVYKIGILVKDSKIFNKKYIKDDYLLLGNTFVTAKEFNVGDNIQINVEEVWRHEYKDGTLRYSLHKPRVMRKVLESTPTDLPKRLDDLAVSKGESIIEHATGDTSTSTPGIPSVQGKYIRKKIIMPPKKLSASNPDIGGKETGEKEEGGTRSEAAKDYWKNDWWKAYPKSGKGKFCYQHHWRGLDIKELKLSDEELLKTTNSVHGDLRFEGSSKLFGFTVFLGKNQDNYKLPQKDKLFHMCSDRGSPDNLQGNWKLPQPHSWLDIAKDKPFNVSPGGSGATENKYAKFFNLDYGTYEIGVWREHFFEFFVKGKHLTGRMLIQYAPMVDVKTHTTRRIWIIDFPKDQRPYATTHDLEKVKSELKQKGQKHLIWAKPGETPTLIKI